MVIKTGAGKWPPFFAGSASGNGVLVGLISPQATALWRWRNCLQRVDAPDKIRVLINVDETNVRLVPDEGKGHLGNRAYRLLRSGMPLGRDASLGSQRASITHVAAICDHKEIQKRLPQVVLVGEHQFTQGSFDRLRSEAPAGVHLWREKSLDDK